MLEWSGVLVNGVGAGYVLIGQTFLMIQADRTKAAIKAASFSHTALFVFPATCS